MKLRTLCLSAVVAVSLVGCVVSAPPARGHRAVAVVDIDVRPPPPRVVVVPQPRRGYVWASGYWRWDGRHHVWIDGRWVRERRGAHWVPAHWEEGRNGRWHFEDGHWDR